MAVLVFDKHQHSLMPCREARARRQLEKSRAVNQRMVALTIRLKDRLAAESLVQPVRLKLDPGRQTTGMAFVGCDMQLRQHPEIRSVEGQPGAFLRCEACKFLLEKWGRQCADGDAQNVPLKRERFHPKVKGGSGRVSNLSVAGHPCNQCKGKKVLAEFLTNSGWCVGRSSGEHPRTLGPIGDEQLCHRTWPLPAHTT